MGEKRGGKETMAVANRIKSIRKGLGLTQEQFAEQLNISVSTCKKIETGERFITTDLLIRLSSKFEVSADYILVGEKTSRDSAWRKIANCSEHDKMYMLCRLLNHFVNGKCEENMIENNDTIADSNVEVILEALKTGKK